MQAAGGILRGNKADDPDQVERAPRTTGLIVDSISALSIEHVIHDHGELLFVLEECHVGVSGRAFHIVVSGPDRILQGQGPCCGPSRTGVQAGQ